MFTTVVWATAQLFTGGKQLAISKTVTDTIQYVNCSLQSGKKGITPSGVVMFFSVLMLNVQFSIHRGV